MNRFTPRAALGLASALTLWICAPTADAQPTMGGMGSAMRVVSSGFCMAVSDLGRGTLHVIQSPCVSGENFRFYARPIGNSRQYFSIEARGRCLDVPASSQVVGQDVQLVGCHRRTNQQFEFLGMPDGSFQIRPRSAPHLCLDVEDGTAVAGKRLQQFRCVTPQTNQHFLIRPTLDEERFDFDSDDTLVLRWPDPASRNPWNNPLDARLANGGIIHFAAFHLRWSDGSTTGPGWWDDEKICPAGTTRIEVSRQELDRDTFRIRCFF